MRFDNMVNNREQLPLSPEKNFIFLDAMDEGSNTISNRDLDTNSPQNHGEAKEHPLSPGDYGFHELTPFKCTSLFACLQEEPLGFGFSSFNRSRMRVVRIHVYPYIQQLCNKATSHDHGRMQL